MPIYVTGHSLGGAMSAILHSEFALINKPKSIVTHSCYTFGMPRYGNKQAIESLENPFHIFSRNDVVPTVPYKWLGYENSQYERMLDGNTISKLSYRNNKGVWDNISSLFTLTAIYEHYIEVYVKRMRKLVF